MDHPKQHGVRFDATINLGHIITFIGFLLAGFGAWATLDKRLVVIEESRNTQKAIDMAQDARFSDSAQQIKDVLVRLDRQVERLSDRLDRSPIKGPQP